MLDLRTSSARASGAYPCVWLTRMRRRAPHACAAAQRNRHSPPCFPPCAGRIRPYFPAAPGEDLREEDPANAERDFLTVDEYRKLLEATDQRTMGDVTRSIHRSMTPRPYGGFIHTISPSHD